MPFSSYQDDARGYRAVEVGLFAGALLGGIAAFGTGASRQRTGAFLLRAVETIGERLEKTSWMGALSRAREQVGGPATWLEDRTEAFNKFRAFDMVRQRQRDAAV